MDVLPVHVGDMDSVTVHVERVPLPGLAPAVGPLPHRRDREPRAIVQADACRRLSRLEEVRQSFEPLQLLVCTVRLAPSDAPSATALTCEPWIAAFSSECS